MLLEVADELDRLSSWLKTFGPSILRRLGGPNYIPVVATLLS